MAVAEHSRTRHVLPDATVKTSRREVLAAVWAVPAVLAAPLRRQGPSWIPDQVRNDEEGSGAAAQTFAVTKWDRALARFRRAEAVLAAAAHEPDDEVYGDRVVAFNRTVERLLAAPAPGLPALATKLALAVDQAAWELPAGDACMAALVRDTRRLCG